MNSPGRHLGVAGRSWPPRSVSGEERSTAGDDTKGRERRVRGMARAILEVRDLWVGDGPGAAVQGVDFVVGPGQVLGILGGPDAGKSRLLRCVGLDFPPTRGAVFL